MSEILKKFLASEYTQRILNEVNEPLQRLVQEKDGTDAELEQLQQILASIVNEVVIFEPRDRQLGLALVIFCLIKHPSFPHLELVEFQQIVELVIEDVSQILYDSSYNTLLHLGMSIPKRFKWQIKRQVRGITITQLGYSLGTLYYFQNFIPRYAANPHWDKESHDIFITLIHQLITAEEKRRLDTLLVKNKKKDIDSPN